MNDPRYQKLCETSWRRKLSAAEEAELRAWLAAHPEAEGDWAIEAGLNEALNRLPETPVSSNFTARVLQAVERELTAKPRRAESKWSWLWRPFLPRVALASMAFCVGLAVHHGMAVANRTRLAESVVAVSNVASLPSPEALQNFEVIRRLTPTPPPDPELLAVLASLE
jgi:anti-sigma factor RsiW